MKKSKVSITLDQSNIQLLNELEDGMGLNRSELIRMVLTMYGNHLKGISSKDFIDVVAMKKQFIEECKN